MEAQLERKILINRKIITFRWFYLSVIALIGVFASVIGKFNMPFWLIGLIYFSAMIVNAGLYYFLFKTEGFSEKKINFASRFQIFYELFVFTAAFYAAGALESVTGMFLFLPIISASLLLTYGGLMLTSVIAGLAISGVVALEFFHIIPHLSRYGLDYIPEYGNFYIAFTQIIAMDFFFVLSGVYCGFSSNLLLSREKTLAEKNTEITETNKKLDEKLSALKKSQKETMLAYHDLSLMEEKMREEHGKISAIISSLVDPIIMLDTNGKIVLFNPVARTILGLEDGDYGKIISNEGYCSLENFRSIIKKDYNVKQSEIRGVDELADEEFVIKLDSGQLVYKVITIAAKDKDQKNIGILKIFYNMTREKNIDRMKSDFISVAAHQLRTPLSAIKWAIKMVLDGDCGPLNDSMSKVLDKGFQSNERVIKLINDMLNVSRIEDGYFGYNFLKEDIELIINHSIENLHNKIEDKKIKFLFERAKNLPDLSIDKEKFSLALENILDNAIKYTPENGTISLKIKKLKNEISIIVEDNGIGISTLDQKKVFSKFFRGQNALRVETDGSGLGLFIAKNIIEKHGGRLEFSSQEGEGSEFVISFPLLWESHSHA